MMDNSLLQGIVQIFIALSCPVCREDLAGPTTRAAAASGLKFEEIFCQLPPVRSRAWDGLFLQFVHRNHLN